MTQLPAESNRIEYKRELNDSLEKEVVAFLNSSGGNIFIGIDDHKTVVGIGNIDHVQQQISNRLKTNISPSALGLVDISVEEIDNKPVIKIITAKGPDVPYYITQRGMTPSGCFMRVGNTSRPMEVQQIEKLFAGRVRTGLKNVESPRQDLTFSQLKIYYQEKGSAINSKFLENLDLYTSDGKFNYVAYLVADINSVSMKVAKYAGTNKVQLVENKEFGYCSIIKATNSIIDALNVENKTFTKITYKKRLEVQEVDSVALREAIINAIVHNDYLSNGVPLFEIFSDRVVITSHGGLPHGLDEEEFFSGMSLPRNREIMRIFKDIALVEQLGSGMQRILELYPRDIFKISKNFLTVTFQKRKTEENSNKNTTIDTISDTLNDTISDTLKLSSNELRVLQELRKDNHKTRKDLADILQVSVPTVARCLESLKNKNLILRQGPKKNGYWKMKNY